MHLLCRAEAEQQGTAMVLHTLVPQARKVFKELAEHQLLADEQGQASRCSDMLDECGKPNQLSQAAEHQCHRYLPGQLALALVQATKARV